MNTQNIDVTLNGTVQEKKLGFGLETNVTLPLGKLDKTAYWNASGTCPLNEADKSWYKGRCGSENEPYYGDEKGELTAKPSVTVDLGKYIDNAFGGVITVYGKINYNFDSDYKYGVSESNFRFKNAGLTWAYTAENKEDILKGVNVYYGLDNSNAARMFNTLIGQISLPLDFTVTAGVGLKTINSNKAGDEAYTDTALNNPFAAVVGVSKKLASLKKPIVYAQFVYNTDPFKGFGDGQDGLNLSGANVSNRWEKEGAGKISAVDYYDGKAAMRVGIRWDI